MINLKKAQIIIKDFIETSGDSIKTTIYFKIIKLLGFSKKINILQKIANKLKDLLPEKEFEIKNSIGIFYINTHDDTIIHSSIYFEYQTKEILKEIELNDKNTIIDIGANTGLYSIFAIKKLNFDRSVAIEPSDKIFNILTKNIESNNLNQKIIPQKKVIGEENKEIQFKQNEKRTGTSKVIQKKQKNKNNSRKKQVKLTKLINNLDINFTDITLLKIDIEGYEYYAVLGARELIKKMKKGSIIVIELFETNKFKEEIISILQKHNFKIQTNTKRNYIFEKI
jgi:FkbM family methyltransferase